MLKQRKTLTENTEKGKKWMLLTAAVVFFAMLILNLLTVMVMDDYRYCFSFADNSPIESFGDVVRSQMAHYQKINGRIPLHFLVQLFLLLPAPVFQVLNAAVYTLLGVLIYLHAAYGRGRRPGLLVLIYCMMWLWLPEFGTTVLWLDGSCNYLWGTTIILLFLLPYRIYAEKPDCLTGRLWIPGMLLAGVLAGWCNENTSGAAGIVVLLMVLRYAWDRKKVPAWSIAGLAGLAIGFLGMLTAPGNAARIGILETEEAAASFMAIHSLSDLLAKFIWLSLRILDMTGPWPLLLTLFLLVYLTVQHKTFQKAELPFIYLVAFLGCCYAMIIPPFFAARALFGAGVLWLIGLAGMLAQLECRKDHAVTAALMVCLLAVIGTQYIGAAKDNALVYRDYQQRISSIESQKTEGKMDVEVEFIQPRGRYSAWTELSVNPGYSTNINVARYFGVDSVAVTGAPEGYEDP